MMYVARFSKQTQLKKKILANKVDKERRNQQNLSNTERQYTLPQRQQLLLAKFGLTTEQLTNRLLDHDSVEIVDASFNQITHVPHLELSNHCHFLIELNLSNNAIKEVPEETFRSIQLLEVINLSFNELRKLPDSLFSLQKLISLDLSANKIALLQPKVSLLKNLRMLLLEGNPISRLPNSIGYLNELEQISVDIFSYLPAQSKDSVRIKSLTAEQTPTVLEFPQQRQLIVRDQLDYRFAKLMLIMQTSKKNNSAFLELAHSFQFQRTAQHEFFDVECDREMEQMEELLSVQNYGFAGSLLHCVAANNHSHLIEETVRYLQQVFGADCGGQQQLRLQSVLRTAVNAKNSFDQTPLEVAITYQYEESAEEILTLLGHFIDIEFRQINDKPSVRLRQGSVEVSSDTQNDSLVASNDQSAFMKPGNQQSELVPFQPNPSRGNTLTQSILFARGTPNKLTPVQVLNGQKPPSFIEGNDRTFNEAEAETYGVYPAIEIDREPQPKMHPLVITLANANFGVSYKLLEAMNQTFQRKFANYQQLNKVETNLFATSLYRHCYDLNCVDPDGLSFLHHLFANFSRQHEKAVRVFKLMLSQTQQIKNPNLFSARLTINSPLDNHEKQKELPPPYKSLMLNQVTNFGETPFVLAIEHQQNSAVDFAVNFNIQQLQQYLAQLRSQYSDKSAPSEVTSFWNTPQAKMARNKKLRIQLDMLRSPSPKSLQRETQMLNQVFDLSETKNMREITPIHRAVIKSNYAAVNSMLQSAITIRRLLQERIETPNESKLFLSYVPRSIIDQILVDVFKIDSNGKTPREYALKMVFMSKILRQAESSQIWSAITLQSAQHRLYPLLKPESHAEFYGLKAVSKPLRTRPQVRNCKNLSRFFRSSGKQPSTIEMRTSSIADEAGGFTRRTTYDSEQRACSKGVKKAKSMAFNTIQYRAETSSQLSSASQLLLSQRMRVPSQVSKPNQPSEEADFQPPHKKKTLQIETGNTALKFAKIGPQFEFKLASAQNLQQMRRFNSPAQQELKAIAQAQLNNSNASNSQTNRTLQALPTTKGNLPTIQRIALNAAEGKDFTVASSAIKNQRKLLAKAEADASKSDMMCLEDLEDSRTQIKTAVRRKKSDRKRKTKVEETIEGFNVGDSSGDEDFAALPSIQNEYTLQIKSFYQYKKPYIQQLQSNQFESEFYTILGEFNPCSKPAAQCLQSELKLLAPQKSESTTFEKVACLYSIVQRATNAARLQDAKDVLDFLLYEIDSQANNTPVKLTAATGLAALNSTSGYKALDSTSSRNNSLNFLKVEIIHLRAQLDLLSKQMVSVPWEARVDESCSDSESEYSSTHLTPVETPNIHECMSSAQAQDEAEAEDDSAIECQEIRIATGRANKQDTIDITDFEDCSEKLPFGDGQRLSITKEQRTRAEALMRNTAIRSPGSATVDLKKTLQRMPSASQYIPQQINRFENKRKSDYGYHARPDLSKPSSVRASLNSAIVPNTTRASFGPQTGFDLQSTTKANKLAYLLDPKTIKSFAQSQMNVTRPMLENVETEECQIAKNRPLASNGLQSFSLINKELQTIKMQMNNGDKLSSTTEHESCQNQTINQSVANNEAVLEETPVSLHKLPVKISAMTALPGSFTDRQSQARSLKDLQIDNVGTPYLNQEPLDELIGSQSDQLRILNKHAQSILVDASDANSNALGLVRRHAAASRMSERYQQANMGQKFQGDDTRMSMKTFPLPDTESLILNQDQISDSSPGIPQHSAKQLIILLGEDQSDMVIDTHNYDSNYSSTKKIGPKKLHQTTVVLPAGFSVMQEKGKAKRDSSISHVHPQLKQKSRKKPSKTIAVTTLPRKETETSSKNAKLVLGKQQSEQAQSQIAVLPPKHGINKQALNTLISHKSKVPQIQKSQGNSRLSANDSQSQKVIKITLGSIPAESSRPHNQSEIGSQGSILFGPTKKQFTTMVSQKTTIATEQRRGNQSMKNRNAAPATKPTIKLQMPKHTAKNEPFYQNPRSPIIAGPASAKISGHQQRRDVQAYAEMTRQNTFDLKLPPNDFSMERKSDTESNKSGAVMTIHLSSFCPAKLTGQPKKKNQRAQGTQSVLFGMGADSNEHAKTVSNKKV